MKQGQHVKYQDAQGNEHTGTVDWEALTSREERIPVRIGAGEGYIVRIRLEKLIPLTSKAG